MRIGELARLTGLAAMTIRYYEKIGLMHDLQRSSSNYRIYGQEDVERLRFIMHCRNQQIPLQDIRSLLEIRDRAATDDAQIVGIIERHEQRIRQQLAALEVIADRLHTLLADKEEDSTQSRGQKLLGILATPCPECPDFSAIASEHIHLGRVLPQHAPESEESKR